MGVNADCRYLEEMQRSLSRYRTGLGALGRLVAELESLSSLLTGSDEAWRARFQEHWSCLEEAYAVALARELLELDDEGRQLVSSAVRELRALVEDALVACSRPS